MSREVKTFTCERCGAPFSSVANHARYCFDCRKIIQKERVKRGKQYRVGDQKTCPTCGKSFAITSPSQIYCSAECKPKRKSSSAEVIASRRKNSDTITFYLPKGSRAILQEACDRLGMNLSDVVRNALWEFLDHETPEVIEKLNTLE